MSKLLLSILSRRKRHTIPLWGGGSTPLAKTLRWRDAFSGSAGRSSSSSTPPSSRNAPSRGAAGPESPAESDDAPSPPTPPTARPLTEHLKASSRSMGQVIFLNSVDSGRVVLASLAVGDPTLAALAALGALAANATSRSAGLDPGAWCDGLWGYNGALIGCAASAFGPSSLPLAAASTLIGAAATPVLSASLRSAITIPQWTWSFNAVALASLMRTRPLLPVVGDDGAVAAEGSVTALAGAWDVVTSPLLGISQIFVVASPLTGAGILAASYLYSPMLAAHALGGSVAGSLTGILLGADVTDVCLGLWGYNSALASMAVGTFFVHSRKTVVLSASSAAASAVLFGAMQTLLGEYGVPCLTLPFCSIASAAFLLEGHIPGLKLANSPHSPEKNK